MLWVSIKYSLCFTINYSNNITRITYIYVSISISTPIFTSSVALKNLNKEEKEESNCPYEVGWYSFGVKYSCCLIGKIKANRNSNRKLPPSTSKNAQVILTWDDWKTDNVMSY